MKQFFRGLSLADLIANLPFLVMWFVLAAGDLINNHDWVTALVHFWTGVIVALFVTRQMLAMRRAQDAQQNYRKASAQADAAQQAAVQMMTNTAAVLQQAHVDPRQMREHMLN